jgi:hypothetical protein
MAMVSKCDRISKEFTNWDPRISYGEKVERRITTKSLRFEYGI